MSCMRCLTNLAAALAKRAVEEEKLLVFTKVCVTQNIERTSRAELIGKNESWYGVNAGSVVACQSHVVLNSASCVCNAKLGIKLTNNSKPWKTLSIWGKVQGDAADGLLYAESDDNGSYNNALVVELPISLADAVEDFGTIGGGTGGEVTPEDLLALGASISYDSEAHEIYLKNSENTVLATVDASDFIVDGMVDNVEIDSSTNALVITYNTDAGKQAISIPLTDIFDPSNYLTKSEIQSDYATKASLATVAMSGDYTDLLNKPTIPTVNNATLTIKKNSSDTGTAFTANASVDVSCDLGLAAVATSGSYADLSNTPSIPAAANNATLTIQKNSVSAGTFTANASQDVTVNISVPTAVSDLSDASNYYTKTEIDSNFLSGASYDSSTHVLTLTSPDNTKTITLTLT